MYWYFYMNRNEGVPISNPWTLEMGKLMVPNVFFDIEIIWALSSRYHAPSKAIRLLDGQCLVDICREAIIRCFDLNKQAVTEIDLGRLKQEYKRLKRTYRIDELPLHMKMGDKNRVLPILSSKAKPFLVSDFQTYFKNTYYALCQILGFDVEDNMSVGLMRMEMTIQHPESNVEFYFSSLLCHLILFQNETKWTKRMKLSTLENGVMLLVQNWCYVWDSKCLEGDFIVFRDEFSLRLIDALGFPTPRLPQSLMEVMRPLQYKWDQGFIHNYGDWFLMPQYTIIRVYGCDQVLHVLLKFVPSRVLFLEFIWKMLEMECSLMKN